MDISVREQTFFFGKIHKILSFFSGLPEKYLCTRCICFMGNIPFDLYRKYFFYSCIKSHLVFEKSDGFRQIFIYFKQKIYLLSRQCSLVKIMKKNSSQKDNSRLRIILDGELCFNLISETYEFLIYDLVSFYEDWRFLSWNLKSKLRFFEIVLKNIICSLKFDVKKKNEFRINQVQNLFNNVIKNTIFQNRLYLNHQVKSNFICNETDGIVLTPNRSFFFLKFLFFTLKWKYENKISSDFYIKNSFSEKINDCMLFQNLIFCFKNGKMHKIDFKNSKKITYKSLARELECKNNKIAEYILNKNISQWVYCKDRKDKRNPNSIKTLVGIFEIINENTRKNELIDNLFKLNIRINRGKF
nr:mRNA capping enzyme [Cryptomonas paramecium]